MWFRMIIYAAILLFLIVGMCVCCNRALCCEYYKIRQNNIPRAFDNACIVMISDLHERTFGKHNVTLVEKISLAHPDYIVIAGDLLVKGERFICENSVSLLKQLVRLAPVYFAPGNHEDYMKNHCEKEYLHFLHTLEELGVVYLDNASVILERGEDKLRITGLSLPKRYFAKFWDKQQLPTQELEDLIGKKTSCYQILIAHHPDYFSAYASWGADLVFSGHVHGGVVILPFIGGVISTSFQLFPKYDFGLFEEGETKMVLSRGLGVHTIPLRIGNVPEISVIRLERKRLAKTEECE